MKRIFSSMIGFAVRGQDGIVGSLADFYYADSSWMIRYWVVRRADGWPVLIAPAAMDREPDWLFHELAVNLSLGEIANAPAIDLTQPVTRREEESLASFYRWPAYWRAGGVWRSSRGQVLALPTARNCADVDVTRDEPHRLDDWETYCLRSFRELDNFHIRSEDDDFGPVEDAVLETTEWGIAYLAVGAVPGRPRQVLIPPAAIDRLDTDRRIITTTLKRHQLETAPSYEPSLAWTPDMEARYQRFYDEY